MECGGEQTTLNCLWAKVWDIILNIEKTDDSSNSKKYQTLVKNGIDLATDAIKTVNLLSLFSQNEQFDELSTKDIKFLLLPAFLGFFSSQLISEERLLDVQKSMVFYNDFLRMCKSYEVSSVDFSAILVDGDVEISNKKSVSPSIDKRQSKVARYRAQKLLESKLITLRERIDRDGEDSVDDEIQREYYATLVRHWINRTLDELDSLQQELDILQHRSISQGETPARNVTPDNTKEDNQPVRPFRPFILTRDKIQAQVFGAGYPSLPVYSMEQWYEMQVAAGRLSQSSNTKPMRIEQGSEEAENEKRKADKDKKEELDDEVELAKQRQFDDYKDDHRRGWGNTYNKG